MNIARFERIRKEGARLVATGRSNVVVGWIDQPGASKALGRRRRDFQRVIDLHVSGRSIDKAAVATRGCTGVQGAGGVDRATLHVTQQLDRAAACINAMGLDDARVVDYRLEQVARRLRTQQYAAAVGLDQTTVLDQRTDGTLVDRHMEQAVARHV